VRPTRVLIVIRYGSLITNVSMLGQTDPIRNGITGLSTAGSHVSILRQSVRARLVLVHSDYATSHPKPLMICLPSLQDFYSMSSSRRLG